MKSAHLQRILEAKFNQESDDRSGDVVFAIFLEPHDPPPGSDPPSFLERALSFAVNHMQQSPVMTHVELIVPCAPGADRPVNFATYVGSKSGWQTDQDNNELYYLRICANKWRAVPIFGKGIAKSVRDVCDRSCGIHYSLLRYVTASWAFRGVSRLVPDRTKSPAHCATLTARILRSAVGKSFLRHTSAWYSPSSLYSELCESLGCKKIAPDSTLMTPDIASLVNMLLRFCDEDIKHVSDEEFLNAIRALTLKVAAAEAHGDTSMRTLTQKQLGTVLLRWSVMRSKSQG